MVNRYDQLLAEIPRGSAYDSAGNIIPYRAGDPYEFQFAPVTANRVFGVFVNNQFRGEVTSDGLGVATVSVTLEQGRQDIVIIDKVTQAHFNAFVDVRVMATVLAAHADVFGSIDTSVQEVEDSFALETATPRHIEDLYGRQVRQPNDLDGWLLDSYRRLLFRLRQAFRVYGSKLLGLRQAVSAYTSALPLRIPRDWRPNWTLGTQLMPNGDLQAHARLTASPLTNLNARQFTAVHAAFGGAPTTFPGPFVSPAQITGGAISAPNLSNIQTLTQANANFTADLIGESITIASAAISDNDGTFIITAVPATDRIQYTNADGEEELSFLGTATILIRAQPLQVRFSVAWDGGSVTINGSDPLGNALTEVFTPLAAQPLAAAETVVGLENFALVSDATKGAGAAGTASIGVADDRFIELVAFGPINPTAARTLEYLIAPDRLRWNGAPNPAVEIPRSGQYTVQSIDTFARWFGLALDTGAGYAISNDHRYLALEFNDRGTVVIDLLNAGFGGGASPRTAAQVATSINTYFQRDTRYGAVQAIGTITCIAANLIGNNETFTVNDGINAAVVFRYRRNDLGFVAITAQDINIDGGIPQTAASVASSTLAVMQANAANFRVTTSAAAAVLSLTNDFGGVQGNVVIADTVVNAGFTHTGMAGGVNGLTLAAASACVNAGVGTVVRLQLAAGPTGEDSNIRIHPWGADGAGTVFGEPRFQDTLQSDAFLNNVALDGVAAARLSTVAEVVILHAAFVDTASTVTTAFTQPSHPTALEFILNAAWRGGTLRVLGTALGGATIQEDFVSPDNEVASGTLASSADGTTILLGGSETFGAVEPGMFFRRATGVGAFVRFVDGANVIRLYSSVGVYVGPEAWTLTQATRVQGTRAFDTIAQITNFTPAIGGTAGTATPTIVDGDTHGYDIRLGRGLRSVGTGGAGRAIIIIDPEGKTATFQDTALPLVTEYSDLGGWVLITGSTSNNGLHKIVAFGSPPYPTPPSIGADTVTLEHQDADRGGRFVTESPLGGGVAWRLYNVGELLRVIARDTTTGDLTLFPPGLRMDRPTGDRIELASELPFTAFGNAGTETLTVNVDRTYLPAGATSDSLTAAGTAVSDGWRALNQASVTIDTPGYFNASRLNIVGSGVDTDGIGTVDQCLQRDIDPDDVVTYRGFVLHAAFWLQQHVDVSESLRIDFSFNGAAFAAGTAVAGGPANPRNVVGTHLAGTGSSGSLDPTLCMAEVEIPFNANTCTVRLRHLATVAGPPLALISVEQCVVTIPVAEGFYLGSGTYPLSAHRAKFGEVLYVWSPEVLNDSEELAIGLPTPPLSTPSVDGQIDRIVNAHGLWERFDVSEFSGADSVNVVGAYDEVAWGLATLTNMEIVVGTPARTSIIRPSDISLVSDEVLTVVAPSNAALAETSAHEGTFPQESFDEERLFEGDIPVPADEAVTAGVLPWRFLSATSIQIASVAAGDPAAQAVFNASAIYTINYRRLIRAQTAAFDLGAAFADYLWLVDAAVYQRVEVTAQPYSQNEQLVFRTNLRATLSAPSDQDKTASVLVRDTGLVRTTVNPLNWRYVDASTVAIDSSVFDTGSIYSITYNAQEAGYPRPATVVIEHRSSAVSLVDVAAQTYSAVTVDALVNRAHRFHQLRVTLSGVVDVRDVEISGLGLRGLHLYGASANAPGILTP